MVWSDDLCTGIDEIDEQHEMLMQILNNAHEAMTNGSGQRQLEKVVDSLLSYTRYHFKTEEGLMSLAGYPGLEAHRREHGELVEGVEKFATRVAESRPLVSVELTRFLKEWLRHHILETDREFGRFERLRISRNGEQQPVPDQRLRHASSGWQLAVDGGLGSRLPDKQHQRQCADTEQRIAGRP